LLSFPASTADYPLIRFEYARCGFFSPRASRVKMTEAGMRQKSIDHRHAIDLVRERFKAAPL
jgi:hypothetical protein